MSDCRFCQIELTDKPFRLVAPDGREQTFCQECANDIMAYVLEGKAEIVNLNRQLIVNNGDIFAKVNYQKISDSIDSMLFSAESTAILTSSQNNQSKTFFEKYFKDLPLTQFTRHSNLASFVTNGDSSLPYDKKVI